VNRNEGSIYYQFPSGLQTLGEVAVGIIDLEEVARRDGESRGHESIKTCGGALGRMQESGVPP
jgi:hypothetical protein